MEGTIKKGEIMLEPKVLNNIDPTALSVDVTKLCNLKCVHCFWASYKGDFRQEINTNIIESVKNTLKKYPSITNITWYGAEPLINDETIGLVKKGVELKKNNLVITNGTFPIPKLEKNTHFAVSVDGTEEIHDKLRGSGVYRKLRKNVLKAISQEIPIALLYCINSTNISCIPDFLREWRDVGTIGVVFTVYAPIKDRPLYLKLDHTQRNKAVDILLKMKKKYGKLIWNTEVMIDLIRGKYGKVLAQECLMNVNNTKSRIYSIHMCNDGMIRKPCALGADADCFHCRSVTKLALYAGIKLRDKPSLLALLGMYHSKPYCRENSFLLKNLEMNRC